MKDILTSVIISGTTSVRYYRSAGLLLPQYRTAAVLPQSAAVSHNLRYLYPNKFRPKGINYNAIATKHERYINAVIQLNDRRNASTH